IIGNSSYKSPKDQLPGSAADVAAVVKVLAAKGTPDAFEVIGTDEKPGEPILDANATTMRAAIERFGNRLATQLGGRPHFYYSGHGQVNQDGCQDRKAECDREQVDCKSQQPICANARERCREQKSQCGDVETICAGASSTCAKAAMACADANRLCDGEQYL